MQPRISYGNQLKHENENVKTSSKSSLSERSPQENFNFSLKQETVLTLSFVNPGKFSYIKTDYMGCNLFLKHEAAFRGSQWGLPFISR